MCDVTTLLINFNILVNCRVSKSQLKIIHARSMNLKWYISSVPDVLLVMAMK